MPSSTDIPENIRVFWAGTGRQQGRCQMMLAANLAQLPIFGCLQTISLTYKNMANIS